MIEKFIEILRQAQLEMTPIEVAEMLLLSQLMPLTVTQPEPEGEAEANDSGLRLDPQMAAKLGPAATPPVPIPERPRSLKPGDVVLPSSESKTGAGLSIAAEPFQTPKARALPGAAKIGQALRPLRRRYPSPRRLVIDEERTVQQIADGGPKTIMMRPAMERWLEIALVADESVSMHVWRPTLREFRRLLERHGAFSSVRVWQFNADELPPKLFRQTSVQRISCLPQELPARNGRRLIIVVSDCTASAWYHGEAYQLLVEWARAAPTVLVQVLPRRFWTGTSMTEVDATLRATAAGLSNLRLQVSPDEERALVAEGGVAVPVVTLDEWSIAPWAQVLAGVGHAIATGMVIPNLTEAIKTFKPSTDAKLHAEEPGKTAAEFVQDFRSYASPLAQELAAYLAAVPLSLPVMQLVQQVMLPQSRQSHLAEIFRSDLIEQPNASSNKSPDGPLPDEAIFDFRSQHIRDLLLGEVSQRKVLRVLSKVSDFIESRHGQASEFGALLAVPASHGGGKFRVDPLALSFARLGARTLRRFGIHEEQAGQWEEYVQWAEGELSEIPATVETPFPALAGSESGERLNEAKMFVVGDGKVGKTSLVARLLYDTYNPQTATTLGVEIHDELKVVQSEVRGEGEPIKLNVWDFGGQEIQHATHQLFLTTRSLYLLVLDARKPQQDSNIEYWLRLIKSYGGDSPIIIVINQVDQLRGQRPLNLNRVALQAEYNIRAFVETSCATGQGIAALKAAIAREVEQLQHVRDVWPREWLAVRRRLKGMQANYIPIERYLEICDEEGLHDEDTQKTLLGLLHDLGEVIRFPGDTQVLNPRWVTQGVNGLLTSAQLVKTQGQFDLKDVGQILASLPDAKVHYPLHTHRRLIDVMRHFELCFEFADRPGHYLIPRYLPDNEPDIKWDDTDALKFQYHYETLPDTIISRFIVRMNQYITKDVYWKNGVFLHDGDNQAKIKADVLDRKIFISVIGKEQTRRAFLAVIRSAFDEINRSFNIEIKQMIPVPGSTQVLVSHQDLLAYEEMNEPQIIVPELRKKFSVKELLDGVEDLNSRMKRRERDLNEGEFQKQQPRIFRIVVASPGDVRPERDVLLAVIEGINRGVAAERGLHLVLAWWETDTYPGFHLEGPQGLIDPILRITDCDLLIGIFWKRFGTPAADGTTGTEHEFNLAFEAWQEKQSPQIFVYFNLKPYTPKSKAEAEQWGQVLDFQNKFPKEGLWWPYKGTAQFEKLVRNHLTNYIRRLT